MVFQQYNLFPHRTALQNVMMAPIQVLKRPTSRRSKRKPALCSRRFGSKARKTLIRANCPAASSNASPSPRSLAMKPDLMLFDEVTAALDPETVREVLVTIRQLAEEGMTCILVTHEMGFAREVANEIYFTDKGVIVEHGPPSQFFSAPARSTDQGVS